MLYLVLPFFDHHMEIGVFEKLLLLWSSVNKSAYVLVKFLWFLVLYISLFNCFWGKF